MSPVMTIGVENDDIELQKYTKLIRKRRRHFLRARTVYDGDDAGFSTNHDPDTVSRQLVYGLFVYDTSSTDISSTDISSTTTFLAEIEAGVMKRIQNQ